MSDMKKKIPILFISEQAYRANIVQCGGERNSAHFHQIVLTEPLVTGH